jgi:hypothetical protein
MITNKSYRHNWLARGPFKPKVQGSTPWSGDYLFLPFYLIFGFQIALLYFLYRGKVCVWYVPYVWQKDFVSLIHQLILTEMGGINQA